MANEQQLRIVSVPMTDEPAGPDSLVGCDWYLGGDQRPFMHSVGPLGDLQGIYEQTRDYFAAQGVPLSDQVPVGVMDWRPPTDVVDR